MQTDNGSALHEAALFGKMDVVRLLLDSGASYEYFLRVRNARLHVILFFFVFTFVKLRQTLLLQTLL